MLEVRDLTVAYGGVYALRGVNMAFSAGEITTVIGSNGAGKTSLLRAIAGLQKPLGGSILFDGEHIDCLPASHVVLRGISLVPEGRELFPLMSVRDNLLCGAHLRTDKVNIQADLERVYGSFPVLARKQGNNARSLSGGEQQMLAIGRAIMSRPKFYLFDEPSIGLAPKMEHDVIETIKQIALSDGVGVVLVEQNAVLALEAARFGYVLDLGQLSTSGPTETLKANDDVRRAYLGF
jgi:branched-chain amino acid transport system ATP-binding protein